MMRALQDAAAGVVLLALFGAAYYATGKLGSVVLRAMGCDVQPFLELLIPAAVAVAYFVVMAAGTEARELWERPHK